MSLKAILFDKDGVLVDFDQTWVTMAIDMAEELSSGDNERRSWLLEVAGFDEGAGAFAPGSVWAAGNTADLVDVWNASGSKSEAVELTEFINMRCEAVDAVPLVPTVDLQNMFEGFRESGLMLGLATNDVEASARKTMTAFGLAPFMHGILGYDSVENPKPAGDPVHAFCGICDILPADVLVIGDNLHDMEMAMAAGAGWRAGVLSGNSSREDLSCHADFILDSVASLPQLLADNNLV